MESYENILLSYNGTNRDRTCDPLLVRQVLSQLSYDPKALGCLCDIRFCHYTIKLQSMSIPFKIILL